MLNIIFGVVVAPVLAIAMFTIGLLAAIGHLIALPLLYGWERYAENRPIKLARRAADPSSIGVPDAPPAAEPPAGIEHPVAQALHAGQRKEAAVEAIAAGQPH